MKILYNNKSYNIEKIKQKSEYFNTLYNSILINDNDELDFNLDDRIFDDEDDIDDEEVEGLFDDLRESLDMFKRFTKYN